MRKHKVPIFFADSIEKGRKRGKIFKNFPREDFGGFGFFDSISKPRVRILKLLPIFLLLIFLARLFQLTVIEGSKNRDLAENNRVRQVSVEAKRGRIMDANGQVLAQSLEKFFLEKDGISSEITRNQAQDLENEGLAGQNFLGPLGKIKRVIERVYPFGETAAHVVGYTSVAGENDIKNNSSLQAGDFVGRLGIEQTYDAVLRGTNGKKIVEVDAGGKTISILGEVLPKDGEDISTTIDINLQKKAYEAFKIGALGKNAESGAVIISNPQNGEVFALVSLPSFDPADVGRFVTDEQKPLFNRAIGANYPPGSIFKIVSAIAGLESGKVTRDTEIEDVGVFELGGEKFANWYYLSYGGKDGIMKIDRAIARSNDVFFYRVGEAVGLLPIRNWALILGFGKKTGIDLPGETFGLVGDEAWKLANLNQPWFLGDTMHLAIGQGFVTASPLQVNVATSYIANGAKRVVPHLVSNVALSSGQKIMVDSQSEQTAAAASVQNLDIVRSGMRQACQKQGTAWPFFSVQYTIACKTGTAEQALGNPHAWFTAYAPFENPRLSITAVVENGGEGSSVAAPVVKEILDWYFLKK